MNTKEDIILMKSTSGSIDVSFSKLLVSKVSIASLVDKKIVIDFSSGAKKQKLPFLASREVAWIRVNFTNNTFKDYAASELFICGTEKGMLIEIIGEGKEVKIENIIEKIKDWSEKKYNSSTLTASVLFEYRKTAGKQIKKNISEIYSKRNDWTINKLEYQKQKIKNQIELIDILIAKDLMENNFFSLKEKVEN